MSDLYVFAHIPQLKEKSDCYTGKSSNCLGAKL